LAGDFFRHRGLIAFGAGGAMAEAAVLSFLAPGARPLAPQVTALPPLAAYHDLRWLFAFNQSWLGFTVVLALMVLARSAIDAAMILLAWPRETDPGIPRPTFGGSVVSCAVLTIVAGLALSPVLTLMFGVALLPFSWPYLAAVPILLGTAVALSQGGVGASWWGRLPPVGTAAWVVASFALLTAAAAVMNHLDTPGIVAVAGLAGVIEARAWYGLTSSAVRRATERPLHPWHWRAALQRIRRALQHRTSWVPVAPLAAIMVLVLVVGVARLAFTGAVNFDPDTGATAAKAATAPDASASASSPAARTKSGRPAPATPGSGKPSAAVLVVAGFGSTCCHEATGLQREEPAMVVRQFSYLGLNSAGQPLPYGVAAGNVSIQVTGDRMATQVEKLYQQTHTKVDIVAESEGTLGLYAMLARHPHLPIRSLAVLSPIVEPGQIGQAAGTVPGAALTTLNSLVGGMSPYGSSGAQELIDSVGEFGASYFAEVSREAGLPWLAVVPLADAVTLPACSWAPNVIFVAAFHGGLLGDPAVQPIVETFLTSGRSGVAVSGKAGASQRDLRNAAQLIAAGAAAWRMPDLHPSCPE
jgi:hypothetical protein